MCIHEEEITIENLKNSNVLIQPSTNSDGIKDIAVGNKVFKFSKRDENPSVNVTFAITKIPLYLNLVNATNVDHYNIKVIYKDGTFSVIMVSKQLFKLN